MGLSEFYIEEKGKTPADAFIKAVEAACEAYGENGHTGSIAEKCRFQIIKDSIKDVKEQLSKKSRPVYPFSFTLEKKVEKLREQEWFRQEYQAFTNRPKRTGYNKAIAIAYALIVLQDERINSADKPAGAIEYIKNHWLFFGMAEE